MIVLKIKEWLITDKKEKLFVYEVIDDWPEWDDKKQDYVFKKKPKRISAREAREIIRDNGLHCVCQNEEGKIYE